MYYATKLLTMSNLRPFSKGSMKVEMLILSNDDEIVNKRTRVQNLGHAVTDYVRALFFILGRPTMEDNSSRSAMLLMLLVMKYLILFFNPREFPITENS